jgi:uncharacterized repeat protein (TIGR03803 family)
MSKDTCWGASSDLAAVGDEFYGACFSNRTNGTVYRISTQGRFEVLHTFVDDADGALPGGVVLDPATGDLYGTAFAGGTDNAGTVFRLAPDGTHFRVIHDFAQDGADGGSPSGSPTLANDGDLYGTTSSGGFFGLGAAYRLKP